MLGRPSEERTGFTLIELLVVIAILAILAAILFPVLAAARRSAYQSQCLSNLKQLGTAVQSYAQDWDDTFPYAIDFADAFYVDLYSQSRVVWLVPDAEDRVRALIKVPNRGGFIDQVLNPYTKSHLLWRCPADIGMGYTNIGTLYAGHETAGQSAFEAFGMSYGYRSELGLAGYTIAGLRRPSDVNVLNDAAGYWHTRYNRQPKPSQSDADDSDRWSFNVLYADGHVKNAPRSIFDDNWEADKPQDMGPPQF